MHLPVVLPHNRLAELDPTLKTVFASPRFCGTPEATCSLISLDDSCLERWWGLLLARRVFRSGFDT